MRLMSDHKSGSLVDGRFEIVSQLGEGGMGTVYHAIHREMDRQVALKVLKASLLSAPQQQLRFRNEAQVISTLDHPNIVSIYSVGIAETGAPYIAMELLDGKPLSDIVKEARFLPYKEAVPLFIQACNGLEHAHEQGIIHRDIKPSNLVVMQSSGQHPHVKVVDFGIAKALEGDDITQTSVVIGSAFYLSPGQCEGRQGDAQSDIYALGCSMFEALAGRPPFVGDIYFETMQKHRSAPPPRIKEANPDSDVPESLESIIACCLSKTIEHRYKSVSAVRADLQNVLNHKPPQHIPPSSAQQQPAAKAYPPERRRLLVTICSVIAITALLTWIIERQSHQPSAPSSNDLDIVGEKDRVRLKNGALWDVLHGDERVPPEIYEMAYVNFLAAHKIAYYQEEFSAANAVGLAGGKIMQQDSNLDIPARVAILQRIEAVLRITIADYQQGIQRQQFVSLPAAYEDLSAASRSLSELLANNGRFEEARQACKTALEAEHKAGFDRTDSSKLSGYVSMLGNYIEFSMRANQTETCMQDIRSLVTLAKFNRLAEGKLATQLHHLKVVADQTKHTDLSAEIDRLHSQ